MDFEERNKYRKKISCLRYTGKIKDLRTEGTRLGKKQKIEYSPSSPLAFKRDLALANTETETGIQPKKCPNKHGEDWGCKEPEM